MIKVTQTKWAQPAGQYTHTALDVAKASAEFLITAVGTKTEILWRNGTRERVTDRRLSALQAAHSFATDF